MNRWFLMLFLLLIFTNGNAEERLSPVDESLDDKSFVAFKRDLNEAIRNRNFVFIKKILSDDVEYSFGADPERKNAIDGFLKYYKVAEKDSKFWGELRNTIDLGCTRSDQAFVCPYVYSKWPDKFDSFTYIATIKEKTSIRESPKPSAKVVRFVNFEILKLAPEQKTAEWYAIDLGGKRTGFVSKEDARSSVGYRVEFQKTSTGWKLKYFIAGD